MSSGIDYSYCLYFVGALIILAAIAVVWYLVVRTPMRHMIFIAIRYRLIRVIDWLRSIGRRQVRLQLTAKHSYEELFDMMLAVTAQDRHCQNEIGIKWTDLMAEEGVSVSQDLAHLFLTYSEDMLSIVSLHLYECRFGLAEDPDIIRKFLLEERMLMAEDASQALGHPQRLWRRFGRGPVYGWRTPFFFSQSL